MGSRVLLVRLSLEWGLTLELGMEVGLELALG